MLISSWFITGVLLSVQSAFCSDVQDDIRATGKSPKQLEVETDTEAYKYNHPPLAEIIETKSYRKEKSIDFNDERTLSPNRSRSRGSRRGPRRTISTQLEQQIPVKVIYDAESTPTRLNTRTRTRTTTTPSPVESTTRVVIQRKRSQTTNRNKKIDIRQTTIHKADSKETSTTEKYEVSTDAVEESISSSSEFPQRSRGSYFTKRTAVPTPRVRILEEENFVYSHSGNFHYSFLGGDGTKVSSRGELRTYDNDKTGEAVSGSVSYKDKDGNDFSLSYTADENGYRPVGAHLPTPPPLPPAIARALKYIADKSTTTVAPDSDDIKN